MIFSSYNCFLVNATQVIGRGFRSDSLLIVISLNNNVFFKVTGHETGLYTEA